MGSLKEVTDASFASEVLESDTPVLVDFWAEWCAPCKQVAPVLEQIAEEHKDKLTIVKMNVDAEPNTPREYGVMQIPTMNLYHKGQVVKQIMGAKSKAKLLQEIEDHL